MTPRDLRRARIMSVLSEYHVALIAVDILSEHLRQNPSLLNETRLGRTDFRRFQANLEATYFVRLFAEFETSLRDLWNVIGRDTQPRSTDLLDALATRRRVPDALRAQAHAVREFRNGLVHAGARPASPVPIGEAAHRTSKFLSYMPARW